MLGTQRGKGFGLVTRDLSQVAAQPADPASLCAKLGGDGKRRLTWSLAEPCGSYILED